MHLLVLIVYGFRLHTSAIENIIVDHGFHKTSSKLIFKSKLESLYLISHVLGSRWHISLNFSLLFSAFLSLLIYLKGRNFRGKKISRNLAKFAKINSFFDHRKCQFAKINSREIFANLVIREN